MSDNSEQQARAQLDEIVELMSIDPDDDDNDMDFDEWEERLDEMPLEVSVRSSWTPAHEDLEASEYCILLCTGGPAVRIVGNLNQYNEPTDAKLQHQDWFEGWTTYYHMSRDEEDTLLSFATRFFYG